MSKLYATFVVENRTRLPRYVVTTLLDTFLEARVTGNYFLSNAFANNQSISLGLLHFKIYYE